MTTTATPSQENSTVNSTPGCPGVWVMPGETQAMTIYLPVIQGIILFTAVVGNILVIRGVVITRCKPASYYLIANLATTELISSILVPFYFHYWSHPFEWVFGKFLCRLVDPLRVCCYLVVSFTLAALSVHFFCALRSPNKNLLSKQGSCILVALSWLWGVGLASSVATIKKFKTFKVPPKCGRGAIYHCYNDVKKEVLDIISIVLLVCQLIVPFVIMGLCYGIVIIKLKQHINTVQEDAMEISEMGTAQTDDTVLHTSNEARSSVTTENRETPRQSRIINIGRLLKMLYVMILIYVLCYTPDHVIFIAKKLHQDIQKWSYYFITRKHVSMLHSVPAAIHPFLYGFLSRIIQQNYNCC